MRIGSSLSTINEVLATEERAKLPILSEAVPLVIEMPIVPLPVIEEIVTVRLLSPVPETETVPLAVPVLFKVIFSAASVIAMASLYVTV